MWIWQVYCMFSLPMDCNKPLCSPAYRLVHHGWVWMHYATDIQNVTSGRFLCNINCLHGNDGGFCRNQEVKMRWNEYETWYLRTLKMKMMLVIKHLQRVLFLSCSVTFLCAKNSKSPEKALWLLNASLLNRTPPLFTRTCMNEEGGAEGAYCGLFPFSFTKCRCFI